MAILKGHYKGTLEQHTNIKTVDETERGALIAARDAEIASAEARYDGFFKQHGVDVLLTPGSTIATPTEAEGEGAAAGTLEGNRAMFVKFGPLFRHLRTFNDLHVPSVAVPTPARHDGGLPAGVVLWGPTQSDGRLIQIAVALEAALR